MDGLGTHGGDHRSSTTPVLESLGLTRNQSSRWQLEASVSDERYERFMTETREKGNELTSVSLGLARRGYGERIARSGTAKKRNHTGAGWWSR
jgi:hypothetical protein